LLLLLRLLLCGGGVGVVVVGFPPQVLPKYFSTVNVGVVENFLPFSAQRVLDVGCGAGATLGAWRARRAAEAPHLPPPVGGGSGEVGGG